MGESGPDPGTVIDVRGSACPVPVIELADAIGDVEVGEVVEVWSDDPTSKVDIPVWCRMKRHRFLDRRELADGGHAYRVERTAGGR